MTPLTRRIAKNEIILRQTVVFQKNQTIILQGKLHQMNIRLRRKLHRMIIGLQTKPLNETSS